MRITLDIDFTHRLKNHLLYNRYNSLNQIGAVFVIIFLEWWHVDLSSTAGNYSQGFGKLKPQQEHDLKSGKITTDDLDKFKISNVKGESIDAANAANARNSVDDDSGEISAKFHGELYEIFTKFEG